MNSTKPGVSQIYGYDEITLTGIWLYRMTAARPASGSKTSPEGNETNNEREKQEDEQMIIIIAASLTLAHGVMANPEERAQMMKAAILQRMVMDGWQLVQESQSLMILEQPLTGWQRSVTQLLTSSRAALTDPVRRWSITMIPSSDHLTLFQSHLTLETQNVFGKANVVQTKNPEALAYFNQVATAAAATLPAKYKQIKP